MNVETIRNRVEKFVGDYPSGSGLTDWWQKPLLVTANVDERFDCLPAIAAPAHFSPEALLSGARSIIVYFIPFKPELPEENKTGKFPCRNWALAYNDTNKMIEKINEDLSILLDGSGFTSAVTPPTANFDHVELVSRWSHKHLGHIAGLGRFGINCQLITPAGCTGRLGSIVTDAHLGDHPLLDDREVCLSKRGGDCLVCLTKCPVKALSENEFDRTRCFQRLKNNLNHENLSGLPLDTHVCGKCQVALPCSYGVPE